MEGGITGRLSRRIGKGKRGAQKSGGYRGRLVLKKGISVGPSAI